MDCAILAGPGGKPLGRRSFPNSAEGVDRAARWAARVSGAEVAETHVVVEATAAYHELAAHRLAAAGERGAIVNPARGRSLARALGIPQVGRASCRERGLSLVGRGSLKNKNESA